ncbi:FAD-binding and (Fe-S)-binding domain-containing protein [Undibacterium sp.]|uniref:FAD-binding and (Fe-S)-binding domain-containing protein n=1 Tax=Undibacterium sp. TaxID=1914977 RepID=UPI00374D2211
MLVKPIHLVPTGGRAATPMVRQLQQEIQGDVLFGAADRGRYSTDASIYQIMPLGIVVPRSQEDLLLALDIARQHHAPVLARGAGTSQCGQTIGEALVIDNSKWLNKVLDFDAAAMTVTVEPGLVLDHLNAWLKPHGLWFPVDVSTAAQCTIGGMAGNNSCGSRSIEYGNMVHNVLSIDAVLADGSQAQFGALGKMQSSPRLDAIVEGIRQIALREKDEIREQMPRVLRRVAGYNIDIFDCQNPKAYTDDGVANLSHILVGSEGTLAYSRQLTLKLAPLPKHKTLGVVNFDSFYQAMDMTQHIVKLGPTAVELVDRTMIDLAMGNPAFRPVIEKALTGNPQAILLVEFAGQTQEEQLSKLAQLVELMGDLGLPGAVVEMPDMNEQKALWEVRKAGLNIMMSMKGDGKPVSFIEDCAVPLEHLAEYTSQLTEVFHKYGTEGTWYAHASVGTLHVRPILDMRRGGAKDMREIAEAASALVRKYKGAYSGEHGDGLCRGEWVAWQYGPKINHAFQQIKQLFDPENRFSPDRIVNPPKMDDTRNFRFAPSYQELPHAPQLDWSQWNVLRDPLTGEETKPGTGPDKTGGLAKLVEMCNNNGHCRKFDAGTMCPSYRITKDEKHVTRGRANTLRLAISGQLGQEGLASPEVKETLDLCVSCKGCKRDCPTGVDMAKIKIETKAAWTQKHGLRLRDKLVAYMPAYAPYASRFGGLISMAEKVPVVSAWVKKSIGLATQRSAPRFKTSFLSTAKASPEAAGGKEVLLFVDTFNNYMEPENARAAQQVLEAAGYRVHFSAAPGQRPLCCGRTYLSAGLVTEAKAEARRSLDTLLPFVNRGIAVVGLEPSCLLTLRDEFLHYGYGAEAEKLSASAFLFEEFLVREKKAGRLDLNLQALDSNKVLVHGHCHQKAFDAFTPVQTVLKWVPQLELSVVESSCCGMAGSFGYEDEHYEASKAMGELSLLPAVRKAMTADSSTIVVADGTSCRHQIHDGAQQQAIHVARVLARSLKLGA